MLCIACGNKLSRVGERNNYTIWQCENCGLGVTQQDQNQDYSHYHRDETYIKEDKQFENIFKKRVNIISKFIKKGKVLEVGSSTGILLSLLKKRGWEVQGIEPSQEAAVFARQKGIPTDVTTFEKFKSQKKYDLIIFNHVLEHVDDPLQFLQKSFLLLDKNGIIFIDVPNFGSFAARQKKQNWEYLLPQEHKWHYTQKSLDLLLAKANFKYLFSETHSGVWGYGEPFAELAQSLTGLKKRFFKNFLTAVPSYIMTKMDLGTGLTILGRKK